MLEIGATIFFFTELFKRKAENIAHNISRACC
jgi:hypothetical protein